MTCEVHCKIIKKVDKINHVSLHKTNVCNKHWESDEPQEANTSQARYGGDFGILSLFWIHPNAFLLLKQQKELFDHCNMQASHQRK